MCTDEQLKEQLDLLNASIHSADNSYGAFVPDTLADLVDHGHRGRGITLTISLNKAAKMFDVVRRRVISILCGYKPDWLRSSHQLTVRACDTLINFFYLGKMTWDINWDNPIDFRTNPDLFEPAKNLILYCMELAEKQLAIEARQALIAAGQTDMFEEPKCKIVQDEMGFFEFIPPDPPVDQNKWHEIPTENRI
jgi:hypothetical protein